MMSPRSAGYSGTPLAKKLGIKDGTRMFVSGAPDDYLQMLCPLPEGVAIGSRLTDRTDLIHIFVTKEALLKRSLRSALARMRPDAAIWVSWPKKTAQQKMKLKSNITEDVIRDVALPLGLVDIKVCAVDETWSGLKLVIRRENRHGAKAG